MKPKMISKNKLFITGISGDGRKTGEIWNRFDALYHNNPFSKADKMGIPGYSACAMCGIFMTKTENYSGNDSYCYHCCEDHTLRQNVTMDVLNADIQKLIDIETAHPNLLSDPLLRYSKNWLTLDDTLKLVTLPTLYLALIDGQDCDFTGTQWEAEWLADGKICHCLACNAARRCISDIKLMKKLSMFSTDH